MRAKKSKLRFITYPALSLTGLLLLLILSLWMVVTQPVPRNWLLHKVSQQTGWQVAMDNLSLSFSPAKVHIDNLSIVQPEGIEISLQQGVILVDVADWWKRQSTFTQWEIPTLHITLDQVVAAQEELFFVTLQQAVVIGDETTWHEGRIPLLKLQKPEVKWLQNHTSNKQPDNITTEPQSPPLFLTAVEQLHVVAGEVTLPATAQYPVWHMQDITLSGQTLSLHQGELNFAANTVPGGNIHGRLLWDPAFHLLAQVEQVAVAPLLDLWGIAAQEGILQAEVDVLLASDGAIRAKMMGRLDNFQLANGWQGSWQGTLSNHGDQLHIQLQGLVRPNTKTTFAPTLLNATLNRANQAWNITSMSGEIRPFVKFQSKGDLYPNLQQHLSMTISRPFSGATWLGVTLPKKLTWSVKQPWQAELELLGTAHHPRWHLQLQTGPDTMVFQDLALKGFSTKITAESPHDETDKNQSFQVELTARNLRHKTLKIRYLTLNSAASFEPETTNWSLSNTQIALTWEKRKLRWKGGGKGIASDVYAIDGWLSAAKSRARTKIKQDKNRPIQVDLTIPNRSPLAIAQLKQYIPPAWSVEGNIAGKVTLRAAGRRGWSGHLKVKVKQGQWSRTPETKAEADDGSASTILGEQFKGDLQGRFSLSNTKLKRFDGQLHLRAGEWLVGSFYGDLQAEKLSADLSWRNGKPWSMDLSLQSKTVPKVRVKLAPLQKGYTGQVTLQSMDLGRLFHRYLLEVIAAEQPEWNTALLAGKIQADIKVGWQPQQPPKISGWLALDQGKLQGPEQQWGVGEMALFLPFPEPGIGKSSRKKSQKTGYLRLKKLHIHETTLPPQEVQPLWKHDTLRLLGALQGDLLGGQFQVDDITFANVWSKAAALSLSLKVDEVEIERLSQQLGLPKVAGRLEVDMPEIHWQNELLRTTGTVSAQVFEGKIDLNKVSAEQLFSSLPSWQAELQLADIDLHAMSRWLGVGMIEGTLFGEVRQLHMLGLEPLSFSAQMKTKEGEKEQRISVKAIESIQTLGAGAASGVLQRGILSFFDSFGYQHIGFQCQLKNDTFFLSGVESHDGKEYLVVGSFFPPRVNVVSHNSVISWKDMVSRLKTIANAQHAEMGSEPEIKQGEE